MLLYKLKIIGFKRHKNTELLFSDASFLIGENNVGKSSILEAIEYLLSNKKISEQLFYRDQENIDGVSEIILEAEFRNLGEEAKSWRGFKGRLFPYEEISSDGINRETKFRYFYKKTFFKDGKIKIEAKSFKKTLKEKISTFNTVQDFIDSGFNIELLQKTEFKQEDQLKNKKLQKFIECFEDDFDFYDFDNDLEEWIENPGGIAGNVLSKLPKFLYIPANEGKRDLEENKGALQEVLSELFKDVREGSVNYVKAQKYLSNLAEEMDANDESTEFGKMMLELNQTMDSVFSGISMRAQTILTDTESSIKPSFKITMQSNIETPINQQGTGVIRSAVFALLRYKAQRDLKKTIFK